MARARLREYHQGGACSGWAVILHWCSGVTENEDEKWMRCRGIHGIPRDIPGRKDKALNVERGHAALVWCAIPKSVDCVQLCILSADDYVVRTETNSTH
jgi:hypothetical protein